MEASAVSPVTAEINLKGVVLRIWKLFLCVAFKALNCKKNYLTETLSD